MSGSLLCRRGREYPRLMTAAAAGLWCLPGGFASTCILGGPYSLRCVVFHDVAPSESDFTRGMGVSVTPTQFKAALEFICRYYQPVSLQDVLEDPDGRSLPPRPVLVTFDDGYRSLLDSAIPACRYLGVPAVLFLNAAYLNNRQLAADNLICYVANTCGMKAVNAAARMVKGRVTPRLELLSDVFSRFLKAISLLEREMFLNALRECSGIEDRDLASKERLYLTGTEVRELACSGFEIGNHTRSHIHCRWLQREFFADEIEANKAELEAIAGTRVRSFSVPYGSVADLRSEFMSYLQRSGHELVFLSQAVANCRDVARRGCVDRVGLRAEKDAGLFLEIELLPRLRTIRNRLTGARMLQG